MWNAVKDIIFQILLYIESVVGDWGLAIIVLTVLMRLALMPLTIKQTKSMYELQRIQPQLKELQEKYKDDKEKQQEEMMKFYQENKVNPFGGCLPMLLQMPLFMALYSVLGQVRFKIDKVTGVKTAVAGTGLLVSYLEKNHLAGNFFFLIPNIAKTPKEVFASGGIVAALPYILLVVLFGLSIWLPQALMPGEKQQKMVGAYMAIVMLWFGWSAPAGVLLYWDVSSIWGVAQQQLMMSSMKRAHGDDIVVEEPKAKSSKKKKKS